MSMFLSNAYNTQTGSSRTYRQHLCLDFSGITDRVLGVYECKVVVDSNLQVRVVF